VGLEEVEKNVPARISALMAAMPAAALTPKAAAN